jgi:hypothetical protein
MSQMSSGRNDNPPDATTGTKLPTPTRQPVRFGTATLERQYSAVIDISLVPWSNLGNFEIHVTVSNWETEKQQERIRGGGRGEGG